jgi:hypothetical protein
MPLPSTSLYPSGSLYPDAMAPAAPGATTFAATGVTQYTGTLNGAVDPNGAATTYHFEYGETAGYGTSTAVLSAGSSEFGAVVAETITGLFANTTYHYRVVATNSQGTTNGADVTFTTSEVVLAVAALATKPPLDLHAELVAPDGTRYRWSGESPDPGNVPQIAPFASKRFEGWERGGAQLSRPVDRDYPDLGLFDGFTLVGYDGSVAYEGELGQVPRTTPYGIGVETTGFMADARKRKFREVYVDRDVGRWSEPTIQRKAGYGSIVDGPVTTQAGSELVHLFDATTAIPQFSVSEIRYVAPEGVLLSLVMYQGVNTNVHANVEAATLYGVDDSAATNQTTAALTLNDTVQFATIAPRAQLFLRGYWSGATATPTAGSMRRYKKLAVYGNHGLTARGIAGEPDGFYASDMIANICSRFCPRLSTSGVQQTSWPVPQAAWVDRTDPYDAWLELNKYHLWELAVWEGRTLNYYPSDLTDYDWEVRTTDPGVQVELQGDSTDHLANYCVVQFTNVRTGEADEVSPATHSELRDDSVENPANRHGLDVEFGITLSDPVDEDSAAQIGRAALAENNQPRAIGTITFRGHIRDRAGHWQQGWKPRASETIAITNWPNNRPRLIGEVEWDPATKTGRIAVDSTLRRVDAFLDRYGTALRAAGL